MIIKRILSSMLVSFILTILIEYELAYIFIKYEKKFFKEFFIINLLTNPAIVLIFNIMDIFKVKYVYLIISILEVVVVLVEGKLYKKFLKDENNIWYLRSLLLNGASYLLGVFLSNY